MKTNNLLYPDDCLDLFDTLGCLDYEIYDNPLYKRESLGSFSKYISTHYEEECLQKLGFLLSGGRLAVGKTSKVVPVPHRVQLECGHVEKVYFCELPEETFTSNQIQADVILKVRIALFSESKKAVLTQMYRMTAVISFDNNSLRFMQTDNVSIYKPMQLASPLSEYLVPIISGYHMDDVATEIIKTYYPTALTCACPVSGSELAEALGLHVEYRRLSTNCSILGQLFFEDSSALDGPVTANTIVVDIDACAKFSRNINLVILHECVHFIKHRYFFFGQHLYNSDIHYLCYSEANSFDSSSPLHWVEHQAEQIARRLQIPAVSLISKYRELKENNGMSGMSGTANTTNTYTHNQSAATKREWMVKETAAVYGVSQNTVKYRLASLGCDNMDGIHNYVDGRFIPAYSYAKGSLKKGQTFTIGFAQLLQLCQSNGDFQKKFADGSFVYAEGHICRNNKKYTDGTSLTAYARSHMNECCLAFTKKYGETTYIYQEGSLKNEGKTVGFYVNYDGKCQAEKSATVEDPFTAFSRIQNMIDEMPREFNGTLQYHMERLGWTNARLAEECRISERTVTRLLAAPYPNAKVQTIISLCLGMKLDPQISHDLIRKSYVSLPPTEECNAYRVIVNYMYLAGIEACNAALVQHGFNPLPDCYKVA